MKFNVRNSVQSLCFAICLMFLGILGYAAMPRPAQIAAGQKTKVKGTIASRNGDIVNLKEAKTGTRVVVVITDNTKIERKQGAFKFRRTEPQQSLILRAERWTGVWTSRFWLTRG